MNTFENDYARMDDHTDLAARVVAGFVGASASDIRRGTEHEDQKKCTDLVNPNGVRMAVRVRDFSYAWYSDPANPNADFTIRTFRASGAETEGTKMQADDTAAWILYGVKSEDGRGFLRLYAINVEDYRELLTGLVAKARITLNQNDGGRTGFASIRFADLPRDAYELLPVEGFTL